MKTLLTYLRHTGHHIRYLMRPTSALRLTLASEHVMELIHPLEMVGASAVKTNLVVLQLNEIMRQMEITEEGDNE